MTDKKRVGWIDAAKGMAILAVILGHTYLYGNPIHAISYSFNVPLFFILAGYTFRPKPFKQNLATSAKRLLLPYVGLCLFLIIVDTLRSPDKSSTLASHLLATFFASGGVIEQGNIPMLGLSWFLMALFVARIAFNAIVGACEKRSVNPILLGIIFLALASAAVFEYKFLPLPLAFDQAMIATFFMYLGYAAKKHDWASRMNVWTLAILVLAWGGLLYLRVFFSIGNMFFTPSFFAGLPLTIVASFALIKICVYLDGKIGIVNTFFEFCGRNSLLLLVLHQVEASFIGWSSISIASLGSLSFLGVGAIHLGLVLVLLWLVYLMPISAYKDTARS